MSLKHSDQSFFTDEYQDFKVHLLPCRDDNYTFVIETKEKCAVLIDCSDSEKTLTFLKEQSLDLKAILITHHHHDHIHGVEKIQTHFSCPLYCSQIDSDRKAVPGETSPLNDLDSFYVENLLFHAFTTPGHTKGHISYYIPSCPTLFCGDTLFSLGCGRIFEHFEGVYQTFHSSLKKLQERCPSEATVYCTHEYTESNLQFCLENQLKTKETLTQLNVRISQLGGNRTIPTKMLYESQHNPFLRAENHRDFKDLRVLKDQF